MKRIVIVLIAVLFAIVINVNKKNKERLFIVGIAIMTAICGVYTYIQADRILPSITHKYQTFYSPEYIESGEFVDAFLRLYLDGKTVIVKDDMADSYDEELAYVEKYAVFHGYNVVNYLESVGAIVVLDETMNNSYVSTELRSSFDNMGYINDMLRNSVMYSKHAKEWSNYFAYLWYYRDASDPAYIYVNADSLLDSEDIVLLWQPQEGASRCTEDLYIMGKQFYNENF